MKLLIFSLLLTTCTAAPAGTCHPALTTDSEKTRPAHWMTEPAAPIPAGDLLSKIIALVDDQLDAPDDFSENDESTCARCAAVRG